MTKDIYAIFFRLPFEKKVYKIISENESISKGIGNELPGGSNIIAINFSEYSHTIDNVSELPKSIFDINTARRILLGQSKSIYQRDTEPWNGITVLGKHFSNKELFGKIKRIETNKFSSFDIWEGTLDDNWAKELIDALKAEYKSICLELESKNMLNDFNEIEMYLLLEFIKVGIRGIKIDKNEVEKKCLELDNIYYNAVKNLEGEYKYFVSDYITNITFNHIRNYVGELKESDFSKKYIWDSIELYRSICPFLDLLSEENYAKRDLSNLLRMTAGVSEFCKLQYDIMGTVSGRILITRPGIQYLKRTTRGIFIPAYGKKFVYADYSHFEPGILAYLSKDMELIKLYNNGDLYSNLANKIGNGCTRDIAKLLFLSFIYGMQIGNIKNNIINRYGSDAGVIAEEFLKSFQKVETWKNNVKRESFNSKLATGLTGYTRYFSEDDTIEDISRWAPNHIIQSTASGIFKKALSYYVRSTKNNGNILVPMHDAILIEVSERFEEEEKQCISNCMKKSFEDICPGINCKVHFDNFYS